MSPEPWPVRYPLNTSLVPGEMYFVNWDSLRYKEVRLAKKPFVPVGKGTFTLKEIANQLKTAEQRSAGHLNKNDVVMYIETIEAYYTYWYKIWKGDELGFVKFDLINLVPVDNPNDE